MLRALLELVRPANVATALADVLAGFAVAGLMNLQKLPWLLAASACLYAGGVVLNDVFDRHIDAHERPERPIPSGRIHAGQAAWLGGTLLALGVGLAAVASPAGAAVAAGIAVSVLAYDAWSKKNAVLGPLNMGLCRGLNLTLGMAVVPASLAAHWPLALIPVAYITGVTVLSRGEVSGGRRPSGDVAALLVTLALVAVLGVALQARAGSALAGAALSIFLGWRVLPPILAARRHPAPDTIRSAVRRGVLSLVLLDAAIAASYAGLGYSLALLATALLAGWLARSFAVT